MPQRAEVAPLHIVRPVLELVREATIRKGRVLGKKTIKAVKEDVERTTFPSHVKPTPKNLGTIGHGKLSAKEWLSTCTISLAITLPRIWTTEDFEPTTKLRYFDMLKNFAALVALVNIASRYSISHQDTLDIEAWTFTYVGGLPRLFPAFKIHPYHHIVLHLGEVLRDFGPGYSWAAWAFEYLNGLALQIPSNWKFGTWCSSTPYWARTDDVSRRAGGYYFHKNDSHRTTSGPPH